MDIDAFWKRVKKLIKEKNTTQIMAAKACGRSLDTFRGWMSKKFIPPLDDAYRLALFLNVSLEYLITGRTTEKAEQIEKVCISLEKLSEKLKRYTVKP